MREGGRADRGRPSQVEVRTSTGRTVIFRPPSRTSRWRAANSPKWDLLASSGRATLLHAHMREKQQDWRGALALADQAHLLFDERGLVEQRTHAELIRARASLALGASMRAE